MKFPYLYYKEKNIKIYCSNCLNTIPRLNTKIDLILTDPPYGIAGEKEIKLTEQALKLSANKSENMAVIMDWRYSHRISALFEKQKIGELVWEYGWISGGRTKAKFGILPTHNIILLFGNIKKFHFIKGSIIKRQPGFSSPRQCSYAKKTGHLYEKPIKLIEYLLQNINCNSILDPFMGFGTTLVACKKLNRKGIGIEINKEYCDMAIKRLKMED